MPQLRGSLGLVGFLSSAIYFKSPSFIPGVTSKRYQRPTVSSAFVLDLLERFPQILFVGPIIRLRLASDEIIVLTDARDAEELVSLISWYSGGYKSSARSSKDDRQTTRLGNLLYMQGNISPMGNDLYSSRTARPFDVKGRPSIKCYSREASL